MVPFPLPPLKCWYFQCFDSVLSGRCHPFKQLKLPSLCRQLPHVYHRPGSSLYLPAMYFSLQPHRRLSPKLSSLSFPKNVAISPSIQTFPILFIKYSSSHLVPKLWIYHLMIPLCLHGQEGAKSYSSLFPSKCLLYPSLYFCSCCHFYG